MKRVVMIPFLFFLVSPVLFAQDGKPAFKYESSIVRYEKISRDTPPPAGCTMFVGSSTWTGWGKTFDEDFKDMNAVNRGFGGSTIPDWLRVMDRLVVPHKPARILFFCGTNDLAHNATPEKVIADFKEFLTRLRNGNPECLVYFVSCSHSPVRRNIWEKMDAVNAAVQKMAETDPKLRYIDINAAMRGPDGTTREELFQKDRLHLNRDGQKTWIPVIRKAVLGEEK